MAEHRCLSTALLAGVCLGFGPAQAALEFTLPLDRFCQPGDARFAVLDADVLVEGISMGRVASNSVWVSDMPPRVHFLFNFDAYYEEFFGEGYELRMGGLMLHLCGQTYQYHPGQSWPYLPGFVPGDPDYSVPLNIPSVFECCDEEPQPICQVDPSWIDLGVVVANPDPITRRFRISNVGTGLLEGSVVENCPLYRVLSGGNYLLEAGESQIVEVEFQGQDSGAGVCALFVGDCMVTCVADDQVAATDQPADLWLAPAKPNPFNPLTTLEFSLPDPQRINLSVFDVSGRLVLTLAEGPWDRGIHQLTFDGSGLASGLYYCRLDSGGESLTQKLLLLK